MVRDSHPNTKCNGIVMATILSIIFIVLLGGGLYILYLRGLWP